MSLSIADKKLLRLLKNNKLNEKDDFYVNLMYEER